MEFSRPNAGVGSLSLLQGIFPIQGSNPGLPHCRWILYRLRHQGSPRKDSSKCQEQTQGFPGGLDSEESACNTRNLSSVPGLGRSPGEGHGNLLQNSCLENPHGQRSLTGNSSWGCKESDTTEQLSTEALSCPLIQPAHCEKAQSSTQSSPCGEEPRPRANSQDQRPDM